MRSHALFAGAILPDPLNLPLFVAPSVFPTRPVSVLVSTMVNNCMSNMLTSASHRIIFLVLPQGDGKLPIWQILVAAAALFNTVQNFVTLHLTKRLYNNVPAAHPGIIRSQLRGAWANLIFQ